MLPPRDQRELFDFLASRLESESAGAAAFPDLKALLLAMPDGGEDADFSRAPEYLRDMDLSLTATCWTRTLSLTSAKVRAPLPA